MADRTDILDDLVESVEEGPTLSLATKVAAVGAGAILLKKIFASPKKTAKSLRPIDAQLLGKQLFQAATQRDAVGSVVGLLHICASVLMSVPELRDLGFRVRKIVNDARLKEYLNSGE